MPFLSKTFWPQLPFTMSSAPTVSSIAFNELNDRYTFVFSMPEDATIDSLYYLQNQFQGGNGLTLSIGLQEIITGTGLTATSWLGAGTAFTLATTLDLGYAGNALTSSNNGKFVKNNMAGIALTRGQIVGLTIKPYDGAWSSTGNSMSIIRSYSGNAFPRGNLPYALISPTISASDNTQRQLLFMLGSNNGTKIYSQYPIQNYDRTNLHISSQTYDGWGISWKFPKHWGYTYKVYGARFNLTLNPLLTSGIGYTINMELMDENYNILKSKTLNATYRHNSTVMSQVTYYFDDNYLPRLEYGKKYNLGLRLMDNLGASNRYMQVQTLELYDSIYSKTAFTEADISLLYRFDSGFGGTWYQIDNFLPCIDILVQ